MSDKKEEEYCQENFNSDVEEGGKAFGIGFAAMLGLAIIIYLAYRTWSYYKDLNKMKEIANSYDTRNCGNMNVVKTINLPKKLAPCTAYFKNTEELIGMTNTNNEYVSLTQ